MSRLFIVSNRLPINVAKREGKLHFKESVGGVATGLNSFQKSSGSTWIGWSGITSDEGIKENVLKNRLMKKFKFYPVFYSKRDVERFYNGFCNKTIWPLFHYFPLYANFDESYWEAYERVNGVFADYVLKIVRDNDTVWVHDYHLMLLPKLIREELPKATIGFFLHIPFPSFEMFRLLPQRREILEGILGADLVGFHTYDYVCHFLDSVRRLLGYEHTLGQVTANNRILKVDAFPMGIDFEKFFSASSDPRVSREITAIRKKLGDRKIVLSIDRLDYTKGILHRLEGFDQFLEENPEFKEQVSLVLVAVPSRGEVDHYALLKKGLDELVGKINGKHGTIGWTPIFYLYRLLPFHTLIALYSIADVAMITPLRDGMNLMAKEYVATNASGKGVLVLSEMSGVAKELGEAIIVNPNDKRAISEALREALTLSDEEKIRRTEGMRERLRRYNVDRWARDFIDTLSSVRSLQEKYYGKELTNDSRLRLVDDYSRSTERLILLDYDGTLVPFSDLPQKAKPEEKLIRLLEALVADSRNEIVIISGRDKGTLEEWFGELNIGLVAEHGAWIRHDKKGWELIEPMRSEWKEEIRPILELYVDRTPGSFVEEKTISLVWHYRKADPELASVRVKELEDNLSHLTANTNIGVVKGSKVIEVKNVGIDKGKAASRWIQEKNWGFILAIGDDTTDEDLFAAVPHSAYSVKVGFGASRARFSMDSQDEVRLLLKKLISEKPTRSD